MSSSSGRPWRGCWCVAELLAGVLEAVAAARLLSTLLERIELPGRVGLVRRLDADHAADIDEMLLRGCALGPGATGPLANKRGRRQRHVGRFVGIERLSYPRPSGGMVPCTEVG